MFREMRRKDRQASMEDSVKLLQEGEYGVLATVDGSGMPYAVPLSFVYAQDCIYFHCANEGHKLDNLKGNPQVSFCVVGNTKLLPEKFSTIYQSVIAFGAASIIEEKEEKIKALRALVDKYSPAFKPEGEAYINRALDATCIVKIEIEHITGKGRMD